MSDAAGDWRLGAHDEPILEALIEGTAAAAREADPALAVGRWRADRDSQLTQGLLSLAIGHVDILAEPDESPAARS